MLSNKKPTIIFEITPNKEGFGIKLKTKGEVCDAYLFGIQSLLNEKLLKEKNEKDVKNKRK